MSWAYLVILLKPKVLSRPVMSDHFLKMVNNSRWSDSILGFLGPIMATRRSMTVLDTSTVEWNVDRARPFIRYNHTTP